MTSKNLTPSEELAEAWSKDIGRIFTSEDHRADGPAYMKSYLNTDVSWDGIIHFLDAIGDLNPLYRDPEYAKKTRYKCLIAPPNYIYTITYAQYAREFPTRMAGFYAGSDREWFRPLCEGDKIYYKVMDPSDVKLQASKAGGQRVVKYEKCDYTRQGDDLIAVYNCYEISTEIGRMDKINKYGHLEKYPEYTEEDIKAIYEAQDREEVRGANPRYWEDVQIGDEAIPIVRGPFTKFENMAWYCGARGNIYPSDKLHRFLRDRDPAQRIRRPYDPTFGDSAALSGMKGRLPRLPHASGEQAEAWRNLVLTNWMGDDGFLWKSSTQIRGLIMLGDVITSKGTVTDKYCDNGRYCVDFDLRCENQRGEVIVPGKATVILPSREHGPVIYPEPHSVLA